MPISSFSGVKKLLGKCLQSHCYASIWKRSRSSQSSTKDCFFPCKVNLSEVSCFLIHVIKHLVWNVTNVLVYEKGKIWKENSKFWIVIYHPSIIHWNFGFSHRSLHIGIIRLLNLQSWFLLFGKTVSHLKVSDYAQL